MRGSHSESDKKLAHTNTTCELMLSLQPIVEVTLRDHFAAAALTGLLAQGDDGSFSEESYVRAAYRWADAMLRERDNTNRGEANLRAVRAAQKSKSCRVCGEKDSPRRLPSGELDEFVLDYGREYAHRFCIESEQINHDAAPAARANAESVAPQPTAGDRSGNPTSHSGTGNQPAPPCVETDGFSPGSSGGQINRSAERESPRRECGESSLRDVPQPDNGRAAGGPEHHISEAEIDALEFVVEQGRIANIGEYGILRQLLIRLRQEWEFRDSPQPVKDDVSDRSQPISDNRLAALEELSAMDQELELKHGITGNPMIKARRNKESAGAGITDAGPRLRQMNDVLEENERLRGQLAWTERERDSLRRAIENLAAYVAELSAELFAASAAKTDTTQPRNGALSDGPDPDSRVWDTPYTPPQQATPPQGSVQGNGSFRDSRNANEPVAWAVVDPHGKVAVIAFKKRDADERAAACDRVVPLYRRQPPSLTDEEREAVEWCAARWHTPQYTAATLRGLLERLK